MIYMVKAVRSLSDFLPGQVTKERTVKWSIKSFTVLCSVACAFQHFLHTLDLHSFSKARCKALVNVPMTVHSVGEISAVFWAI